MYKIGDFSRLCRVPVSALRYYADLGILQPAHVDTFTGYRYYTIDQLPRLNRILALKDLGLSLEQIRDLLNDSLSPDELRGMLRLKQAEIAQRVEDEQARLARVAARLHQIEKEGQMPTQDIVLKQIESLHVLSLREVIPVPTDVGRILQESVMALMARQIEIIGPPATLFHDPEFKLTDMDVEVVLPVAASVRVDVPLSDGRQLKAIDLPAIPQAACIIHAGDYSEVEPSYAALSKWIGESGYKLAGPIREVYLTAPGDPAGILTEIQYPVAR
ncbi:MAG: MerR family transcriptional regulator [Anaerolineae bacterium]|nr:MerR family transcriptional regulator [Anaerolineae bacterium]